MANLPAVIDMEAIDDPDDIYEDFDRTSAQTANSSGSSGQNTENTSSQQGMLGDAQNMMTKMVWEAGKSQAAKAWSIYGNIDLLRPYFDVEPSDVIKRCVQAFIPKPPTTKPLKVVTELYGPTMLVMTLIALLLFEMKSAGHTVREGTLIGTAFGICFGYWLGCGSLVWLSAYICNTHISYLQILSMMGYALTGHCIVVFLSTVVHTAHDHIYFYIVFGLFGGLTTLRMVSILISRTHGPSQKLTVCLLMAGFNLLSLLYLHFAFHTVVEEINEAIQDIKGAPVPPADVKEAISNSVLKDS